MADFRTHLTVASIGSGLLATLCLGAGVTGAQEVVALSVVGTLGGILPDLDSDQSSPIRILFTSLAFVCAFLVVFCWAETSSILELWMVWGLVYVAIRYIAWQLFAELTVHRGIFHSVAAALFFGVLTTDISYYGFDCPALLSWTLGAFVCFGYLVHLVLDELFSVDFMNTRIKRSFGTALKLVDYQNVTTSAVMLGAVCLLYVVAPEPDSFLNLFLSDQTYHSISDRFWPETTWVPL